MLDNDKSENKNSRVKFSDLYDLFRRRIVRYFAGAKIFVRKTLPKIKL